MQGPLGLSMVVENRGGGGGTIGTAEAARAPADGKTLLVASQGSHVISAVLQPHTKYDPATSFDAIAMVGHVPMLLVVNPQLPAQNFADLMALARARKLSYGSAGAGTVMNIAGELINTGAKVDIAHIPYRGVAPAIPDLIAGRLDLLPADPPVLLPLVRAGTVRPIAVFGRERLSSLPGDIPTTVELSYPDMIMENWYGLQRRRLAINMAAIPDRRAGGGIKSPGAASAHAGRRVARWHARRSEQFRASAPRRRVLAPRPSTTTQHFSAVAHHPVAPRAAVSKGLSAEAPEHLVPLLRTFSEHR